MKKVLILISLFIVVISLILFFPRSVEHGIVVSKSSDKLNIAVNNKIRSFKTASDFPRLTVVNFKYNIIKAFNFTTVAPIAERIMLKSDDSYDLEISGKTKLSKKVYFYSVDKFSNINLTNSKSIIVGKTNVKVYKNKSGELKTFLISPIDYSDMRVGISTSGFSSVYHDKSIIKCGSPTKLYSLKENLSMNLPKNSIVIVEKDGTNLRLTVNNKTALFKDRIYLKGDILTLQSISRGTQATFNPSYSGVLEFNLLENGLYIVNEVSLEEYLKKVVPSEMPVNGGLEALKCQAVAARTYAIADMLSNRYAEIGFYVDDSTRSQVYNNIQTNSLASKAVDETQGLIMTYNGRPIEAKYYSTSAGTGAAYKDVWFYSDGTYDNVPYLSTSNYTTPKIELPKSEAEWLNFYKSDSIKAIDSDSPYFRWKTEYSKGGLTSALNKTLNGLYSGEKSRKYMSIYNGQKELDNMPELIDIQDIKVTKRAPSGIALEVAYIFSNACVYVRGDGYIRSSLKIHSDYTNEPSLLVRHIGPPLANTGSVPSAFFSVEKAGDNFIIYGGGYGHGAGMSQYGAMSLSKQGNKFTEILSVFYKDIKLEKAE